MATATNKKIERFQIKKKIRANANNHRYNCTYLIDYTGKKQPTMKEFQRAQAKPHSRYVEQMNREKNLRKREQARLESVFG